MTTVDCWITYIFHNFRLCNEIVNFLQYILSIAWSYLITVNTQAYPYMDKMLANVPGATVMEKLAHLYFTTQSGMLSLPLRIPGTSFDKAMKVSEHIQRGHMLHRGPLPTRRLVGLKPPTHHCRRPYSLPQ